MGCSLLDRIRCGRQIRTALRKNKTISTGLVDLGSFQFFRSDGDEASINGSRPAIDFDAAFGGEQALAADFDQRPLAFINPKMGCALLDQIWCCRQIQVALKKNKNDINRSRRTGCVPVLSVRRRRDEASNRGSRPTIVFDAVFGGKQSVGPDFDQQHIAFSLSKVNWMHLSELDKARFGKFNRL